MNNDNDKLIDLLFHQRVPRAVDRIFSENRPQKLGQIYSTIQNKIRANSSELKQTLYRKYQSLINCSQLLEGLNSFSQDLNGISQAMAKIIKQKQFQYHQQPQSKSPILSIQTMIDNLQFLKAMQVCVNLNNGGEQRPAPFGEQIGQKYYLIFLRVQIIEKMQRFIDRSQFNQKNISDVLNTLRIFLGSVSLKQLADICEGRQKELLTILFSSARQHIQEGYQGVVTLAEAVLVRTLFEYKLTTLSTCKSEKQIHRFFSDLLKLSDKNQDQILNRLFEENFSQMGQSLAHIFIQKVEEPAGLKFQYQLYERLVSSEQFLSILSEIQRNLRLQDSKHIITSFKQLWQDYYRQMLTHILQQLNPLNYTQRMKNSKLNLGQLPQQFHCYLAEGSLQATFETRKQYIQALKSAKNNMDLLCQKGDSSQIIQEFSTGIRGINQQIDAYNYQQSPQKPKETQVRARVLLCLLIADYNATIYQERAAWTSDTNMQSSNICEQIVHHFNDQSIGFDGNMLKLDKFFTGYTVPHLQLKDLPIVQNIILQVLQKLTIVNPQAQQRYHYMIRKLKAQPQPLSIYKSCLPNISQYIFLNKMNKDQFVLDQMVYGKYLNLNEKQPSYNMKDIGQGQLVIQDEFQIGDKEALEDMVQIGMKSMKNVGNFISGFMRKH